jgi:hypothetical protein
MILATKGAVAHSGGPVGLPYQWVSCGPGGKIYTSTSTTASSWTSRTSGFSTSDINAVASNGTNLYVAVGNTGKLASSPDGITWTLRTSSFGTTDIYGIAWSGTYWVAVGASGKIATSVNGTSWTQRTSGTTNPLYSSAYGNGLYVVGGSGTPNIFTATNPTSTWTGRTSTISSSGIIWLNDAIYYAPDQAIWVIGFDGQFTSTSTGTLAYSTDGTTWTSANSPFNIGYGSQGGFTSTASVIVGGVFVSPSVPLSDIMSSTNGTTWSNRTPAWDNDGYGIVFAAVDDAGLMVVGGARVQSSTNGSTWTDRGFIAGSAGMNGLCHSAGKPSIR